MTLDTPSLKRLQELEDQLSSLKKERDQLKKELTNERQVVIDENQELIDEINAALKPHQLSIVIDDALGICLMKEQYVNARSLTLSLEPSGLKQALDIIERHVKFIIAIDDKFPLYRHCSSFMLDLSHDLLKFTLLRDKNSKVHFTYDTASETVSAYAITTYQHGCFVKSIDNVTLQICTTNLDTVNYTLKSQTYTETLDRIKNLYDQVVSDMSKAEAQLAF